MSKGNSRLVKPSLVKQFILDYAKRTRHQPFTRVGGDAIDFLEMKLRDECRKLVDRQPSKGKTVKA